MPLSQKFLSRIYMAACACQVIGKGKQLQDSAKVRKHSLQRHRKVYSTIYFHQTSRQVYDFPSRDAAMTIFPSFLRVFVFIYYIFASLKCIFFVGRHFPSSSKLAKLILRALYFINAKNSILRLLPQG